MNNWIRHNHWQPCPVCAEARKGCRTNTTNNITHCRGTNPSPDYRFLKEDKHGFGMYRLESEIEEFSEARKQEWLEEKQRERERWLEQENAKIAASLSNDERDRAIRKILNQLTLTTEDRERLQARGLTNHQIDEAGYRSVVQWQKLEEAVSPALAGVNRYGRGLNNPVDGVLIPVPNVHGQYVALRLHDPNSKETGNPKYAWLASNKQGCTQKDKLSGEYPIAVYHPSEVKHPNKVGIVEGLEWKPKLAAERLGYPVIGVAGVSFFPKSPQLVKEAAATLGATEITYIPDAGAVTNRLVIEPSIELFQLIKGWDYGLSIVWWNQIEKSNGDIDEISLDTEITLISLDEFKSHFAFSGDGGAGGNYREDEEKIKRLIQLTNIDKEIDRQYFDSSDLDDVPEGCNLIFLIGHQGTGKSVLAKQEANRARNNGKASYGVTHRRLLSRSMARQWGIPYVEDTGANKNEDGFTFVINSMHLESQAAFSPDDERLRGSTIVFDEFDQMLDEVFNASTMENKRCLILENLTKTITNIVTSGGRCIFASADLYDFHREFIEGIFKEILRFIPKTYTIRNNYNPVAVNECELIFYNHPQKDKTPAGIYADVVAAIEEGKKIFLQTTSQKVASPYGTRTMEADLKRLFPNLKILRWDSQTNNDPTHPAYGLAEKDDPNYLEHFDVVLVSPVGETGYSVDDKNGHFDINVSICNSGDQDTRTIKQTLRRLRPLVPRWVYIAPRSNRKIGSGKKSPRGILRDNTKQLQKLKGELLTARIIDRADEFDFSEDSMLFLRPWSFSATLKNIDFANYRDRALAALEDVGYVIETTKTFDLGFSMGYEATNDRVKAVRDDEKITHCNAVLEADNPDDERYQQLQKQNDKTPDQQLEHEKGFISRAYAVEPTFDLIQKHNDDPAWLQKLKLHYHLTIGKDYLSEKERKRLESLLEGNGKIFGPEAVRRSRLLKIYWLKQFGVNLFLEGSEDFTQGIINSDNTITEDELNSWYESVINREKELKTVLGVSIWEKTKDGYQQIKPKTLADRFLKLLDLSLDSRRRRGKDGERYYIYHVRRTAKLKEKHLLTLKSEIFQAWLEKDKKAQEDEINHNPSGAVQKSPYSLNNNSKISGQDTISDQDSKPDTNHNPSGTVQKSPYSLNNNSKISGQDLTDYFNNPSIPVETKESRFYWIIAEGKMGDLISIAPRITNKRMIDHFAVILDTA